MGEARVRWNHDLDLLNRFYESDELPESYEIEKQALQEQYEPALQYKLLTVDSFMLPRIIF